MFNECLICCRDSLAVFDKFLAGFCGSHKANLQNVYDNELTKWFVFEAVKLFNKLAVRVLSGINSRLSPRVLIKHLIKHSCSFIKQYIDNPSSI